MGLAQQQRLADYAAADLKREAWGRGEPVRDLIEDLFAMPPAPGSFATRMPKITNPGGNEGGRSDG